MTDRDKLRALWDLLDEEYREKKWTIYLVAQSKTFEFDEHGRVKAIRISGMERG